VGELDLAISDYSVALELDMRNGGNGTQKDEGKEGVLEEDFTDDQHQHYQ
jgi:hypothetical protein